MEATGEATYNNTNTSLLDSGRWGIYTFKSTHLNTDSFNLNDINLLRVALKKNFYLRTRLIKKRKEQRALVIPVRQIQSLASIIDRICTTLWYI